MSDTIIRDPRGVKVKRALISLSNKLGAEELAKTLIEHGVEILSTGGTAKLLKDAGIAVTDVSDHTGFPEIMDGRVKTLHPTIHGGLLARRDNDAHVQAQADHTAYSLTATYDSNIASWFVDQMGEDYGFPRRISFSGNLKQTLRYGENPHQQAALYTVDDSLRPGAARAYQIQGKELSYNNLNDTDAAFELVAEFEAPTVAIIKHANPCGVASAGNTLEAYKAALACDPVSAFGGIIALNKTLDAETASEITKIFVEVIIAPDITADAMEIVAKKKNIRVLTTGEMPDHAGTRRMVKRIAGGLLVQDNDGGLITKDDLNIVSDRDPTEQEIKDMLFAFRVAKHVKSNAIVYAKDLATVGVGAGQMSRVDSARIAAWKAQAAAKELGLDDPLTKGSVVASDAFFPFADGLISAAEAGVTAVIQPGGSIRDDEVIEAANERGLAMVFTGMRHFRH